MFNNKILSRLNLFGTLSITIFALINKETTVFYMMYLFWWLALIEIFTNIGLDYKKSKSLGQSIISSSPSFFMMGLYWVFIVVLFGFAFSFSNEDLFIINAQVFMFQNLPFNLNIIFGLLIAVVRIINNEQQIESNFGVFSIKMMVLHISIILGAFIHFGIWYFYPKSFEGNIYPYLLSAIPFLLLRTYFDWKLNNQAGPEAALPEKSNEQR